MCWGFLFHFFFFFFFFFFFCPFRTWRSDSWRRWLGWSRRSRRGTRGWSQNWTFARIRSEYTWRRGWSYRGWWAGLQHQSAKFGQYASHHASDQASSTPATAAKRDSVTTAATASTAAAAAFCTGKATSWKKEECLGFLAFFAVYFVLSWHIKNYSHWSQRGSLL